MGRRLAWPARILCLRSMSEAQRNDLTAVCSAGQITFDNTSGIARTTGCSCAWSSAFRAGRSFWPLTRWPAFREATARRPLAAGSITITGSRTMALLQTDQRHVLNLSGSVDLPWQFRASFSVSVHSRPPFSAYVNGVDFNGDGTLNDLLPGSRSTSLVAGSKTTWRSWCRTITRSLPISEPPAGRLRRS